MNIDKWAELSGELMVLCRRACNAIADVYLSDVPPRIDMKSDDSPVTDADHLSHHILTRGLRALTPDYPIVSEEAKLAPFEQRRHWERYWLVDPLDGTREYIQRTGEFTVNIALIERGVPVLGLVGVPMAQTVYLGVPGLGAYKQAETGQLAAIATADVDPNQVRVLASSRRPGASMTGCLQKLGAVFPDVRLLSAGSALKFCRLAEGGADLYPRFSPCSEWDTAAGQALVVAAGGQVVDTGFSPLRYNLRASVGSPHFYAVGCTHYDWQRVLVS